MPRDLRKKLYVATTHIIFKDLLIMSSDTIFYCSDLFE